MGKRLTHDKFHDLLDSELSWRKKEISDLVLTIEQPGNKNHLFRSGIVLLYAHWEGYITFTTNAYLEYVHNLRLKRKHIIPTLLALGSKAKIKHLASVGTNTDLINELSDAFSDFEITARIFQKKSPFKNSSLDAGSLFEILHSVGICQSEYETKATLININLDKTRHSVAHGEKKYIDKNIFLSTKNGIVEVLDRFKNDVQNAVATKAYRLNSEKH